jgi:hypothetical protein
VATSILPASLVKSDPCRIGLPSIENGRKSNQRQIRRTGRPFFERLGGDEGFVHDKESVSN